MRTLLIDPIRVRHLLLGMGEAEKKKLQAYFIMSDDFERSFGVIDDKGIDFDNTVITARLTKREGKLGYLTEPVQVFFPI